MKITEEQKAEIIEKIGQAEFDRITKTDPNENHIYAFKANPSVFKAHRIADHKYAFIDISTSVCFANGIHESLKDLLASCVDVKKFKTQSEFIKWLSVSDI